MASGRDLSYTSSEMGGEGRQQSYLSPAQGYQGRDMSYNNSGGYTGPAQQMRHDEFIDQVSTFPGQNNQDYLQQIKSEEYLNQKNNMSGQGTDNSMLQQTGEGVMHAAQGAARGAANMAHGAAAGAANIAQGAASAAKHTLGMDPNPHDSPYSKSNTGIPTHYAASTDYSGNPTATSGHHATNYTTGSDYSSYANKND